MSQLKLFSLYKWDGGNTLNFHEFLKMNKLRPRYFDNYKKLQKRPDNIIFNFSPSPSGRKCHKNYVCVTKEGEILYSTGINPELAFMDELIQLNTSSGS